MAAFSLWKLLNQRRAFDNSDDSDPGQQQAAGQDIGQSLVDLWNRADAATSRFGAEAASLLGGTASAVSGDQLSNGQVGAPTDPNIHLAQWQGLAARAAADAAVKYGFPFFGSLMYALQNVGKKQSVSGSSDAAASSPNPAATSVDNSPPQPTTQPSAQARSIPDLTALGFLGNTENSEQTPILGDQLLDFLRRDEVLSDLHDAVVRQQAEALTKMGCRVEANMRFNGLDRPEIEALPDLTFRCPPPRVPLQSMEVKTHLKPQYTDNQRWVYPQMMAGNAESGDPRIETSFGLPMNTRLGPIPILQVWARRWGRPMSFVDLKPEYLEP
jgi:hypothetical protein